MYKIIILTKSLATACLLQRWIFAVWLIVLPHPVVKFFKEWTFKLEMRFGNKKSLGCYQESMRYHHLNLVVFQPTQCINCFTIFLHCTSNYFIEKVIKVIIWV